jgi:hypothetical protein
MTTQKNTLNSGSSHTPHEKKLMSGEVEMVVDSFIRLYDSRATFFSEAFIKKIKEGNRKALSELQRGKVPPTPMDLRQEFAKCLKVNLSDDHLFSMKDGRRHTMKELKQLVAEWSFMAERALMESDPAWADKLMSSTQWNAKIAFEVTFVSAMNELKSIRKIKQTAGLDHYKKWIINPLKKAVEQVKAVNPPGNSLIGYGDRISLDEALSIAENLPDEFEKALT